ncbi:DUF1330 domain-containing protein [Pseudomonas sp. LMG 31766]|uniref:DUF1330 domain-containing protein n=1 Tax=Pseudomonas chaetocerotis TaxID=2758695 RepID=A0A931D2K2_9PSED|nr:DUF1330 domain-containing protein [Pseudomonas chaetocerotis]MBZ9664249.1 DUF1330 domain-containing protein [Pseudomonas chaetocerotis]
MPSINPNREDLQAFAERMPGDTPILMLNLLRFNDRATYDADGLHAPCSGREAYARYSRTALGKVKGVGGEVQVMADVHLALIAPKEEQWDLLLLVRYPSSAAFLSMLSDPEYQTATVHRSAALADSRLIATTPS